MDNEIIKIRKISEVAISISYLVQGLHHHLLNPYQKLNDKWIRLMRREIMKK